MATKAAELATLPNRIPADDPAAARATLDVASVAETEGVAASAVLSVVPPGVISLFAGEAAPVGFLLCDGAAISRETYADLFAAIGTGYGSGDGSTTFNVPDLRGRGPIGVGTGTGLTARARGATVGAETHTLTSAQMPAHRHLEGGYLRDNAGANDYEVPESGTRPGSYGGGQLARYYTDNTGDGEAHNNMQPSLAVTFIIKT